MQLYFVANMGGEVLRRFQVHALLTVILLKRIASAGSGDATFDRLLALLFAGAHVGRALRAGRSGGA